MFTSNPPKDTVVRSKATEIANKRWEKEVARCSRLGTEEREDINWWMDFYNTIYKEEIKNIDKMVMDNWLRKSEMEIGSFVPLVHKNKIADFAITESVHGND